MQLPALMECRTLSLLEKYMQKMGFNESHQFSACHHTDIKDGDHLHLVINRVDSKGKALNDFQEKKRSQQACREIEKEMGLTQLKDHQQQADGKMNTIKAKLHESIAEAKANGGSIEQLKASLEKRGLELKLHVQSTGRIQGASISDIESGKTWKMSEVYGGKGGFKGIQNELAGKSFEKKAIKTPSHEKSNPLIHSQGSGSNGQTQIPSGGIDSGLIEGAETKEEVEYLIYLKNQQQSKSGGMQAKLGREMER